MSILVVLHNSALFTGQVIAAKRQVVSPRLGHYFWSRAPGVLQTLKDCRAKTSAVIFPRPKAIGKFLPRLPRCAGDHHNGREAIKQLSAQVGHVAIVDYQKGSLTLANRIHSVTRLADQPWVVDASENTDFLDFVAEVYKAAKGEAVLLVKSGTSLVNEAEVARATQLSQRLGGVPVGYGLIPDYVDKSYECLQKRLERGPADWLHIFAHKLPAVQIEGCPTVTLSA